MGCSDVNEFEHIYGQMSTTPSCVYDPLFKRTRMMVVNALIVWKKLIDICFLIKSSLLALTAAYTKFRKMMGSMIWSCATGHVPRCVLLPHQNAGRLHWGKLKAYNFVISGWVKSLQVLKRNSAYHSSDVFTVIRAEVRPSQRVKEAAQSVGCGNDWRNDLINCPLIWQWFMA